VSARPPRRSARRGVLIACGAVVLAAGTLLAARTTWLPPRAIVMATGPEGGAYRIVGERYRALLGRYGLDVRLRQTSGDLENLALLRDRTSGVSVALLQAGTTTEQASPQLASLGTVFAQQIWLFVRGPRAELRPGMRLAAGAEESGTRAVVLKLLKLAGLPPETMQLVALDPARGAEALARGTVDAVALVSSWDSPLVRRLVAAPDVQLVSFRRADAWSALEPSFEKVVLPAGVGDLVRNRPPEDVTLLSLKTSLVVRRDLHPAVQYLLLEAASDVHGAPGLFRKPGQYPAAESTDLPLSDDARRFYRSGAPWLQRYLPYWAAVLAERALLILVPLFGLALPLARMVPQIFQGLRRRRILRLYGELKMVETELEGRAAGDANDLVERLDRLEQEADHLRLPLAWSQMLYTLKQHVRLVRARIADGDELRAQARAEGPSPRGGSA
jgi:TRAP-type uncharacterized transport system substrate-binding protein